MTDQINIEIDQQKDITKTLLSLFNSWDLDAKDQIALLGLPAETKPRTLNQYRAGMAIPEGEQFLPRAHYLLAISNAVDSIFPHNSAAANFWVTTPSEYFGNKTPLDIMLLNGVEGMRYLLNLLNGHDDWNNDGC